MTSPWEPQDVVRSASFEHAKKKQKRSGHVSPKSSAAVWYSPILDEDEKEQGHALDVLVPRRLDSAFDRIPIVDMSLPLQQLAVAVDNACRHVGFMYIINHGMNPHISKQTFDLAEKFFQLSTETKQHIDVSLSKHGTRGYFELGSEDLHDKNGETRRQLKNPTTSTRHRGDWKEGFDCGREDITPPELLECDMLDANQWPNESENAELKGFRDGILAYQSAIMGVARKLLVAFALALEFSDKDYFESRMTKPMSTLRLLHYPPQEPTVLDNDDPSVSMGCGAHTDYGCCTLLNQDDVGGLQVLNSQEEWIDAPPMPNSLVINLGDMMNRWTNNQYKSTVHRVINISGKERYSIPFFLNPNVGTTVECLPTCCSVANPPNHKPIKSEVLLRQRYEETFKHMDKTKPT